MIGNRLKKEQILVLAAGFMLAAAAFIQSSGSLILLDGNLLERDGPGGTEKEYTLWVDGIGDGKEEIRVRVSPKEYSDTEVQEAFDAVLEGLAADILGSNPSLLEVSEDLKLKNTLPEHPGIRLAWHPEDEGLISITGKVNNQDLSEPAETSLTVRLRAGSCEESYVLPVTVLHGRSDPSAVNVQTLEEVIGQADRDQVFGDSLRLPETLNGRRLSYSIPPDHGWIKPAALGIIAAILLGLRPSQEKRKAAKKRETELLLDYSELVSKLLVYLGAGLTVRNAWFRITDSYSEALEAGRTGRRAVYEEMCTAALELKKGTGERRVYSDFAHRCGPKCYLKLASILEQSLRTGDGRMEDALQIEMQEAFEQRKNTALRLGEEAGTKLIIPLMLSLIIVMVIVAVPAMLSLG